MSLSLCGFHNKTEEALQAGESEKMVVRFWGVRGSIPTPGKKFVKYGGNTSCMEVRCGSTILIFDAGTGIRELGLALNKEFANTPVTIHLFIGHTHWDHIQGFPFFALAYRPDVTLYLYGGHSVSTLEKLILGQMDREYFPITLLEMSARLHFVEMKRTPITIDNITIHYTYLFHPGLSLGFRVEYGGRTFVYATDNEVLNDPDLGEYNMANLGNLIHDAHMLVTDCQYSDEEYENKVGWGHSSILQVSQLAERFRVKKLYAFHHDPLHTDRDVGKMVRKARRRKKTSMKIYGAREGDTVRLL